MGCKHNWQISHSNDTYPFRCTKCGKRSTGVNYRKSNKTIPIIIGVISVVVIGGLLLTNPLVIPTNITIPSLNNSPSNSQINSNPQTASNPITYTGCTVASNGLGQSKISCLNQDSITCNSNPVMPLGTYQDAVLTINGNACTVEFSDKTGKSTTWNLSLSPIVSDTQTQSNSIIEPAKNAIGTIQNSLDQASKTIEKSTQNITDIVPKIQKPSQITQSPSQHPFYSPEYGASSHYSPSTDIITLTVMGPTNGFSYNVIIKDYSGTVKHQYSETTNTSTDIQAFSLSDVCKPAEVIVSAPDNVQIYSAYAGTFAQEQACQK